MRVLITGGAGYIGSHTLVELLSADHQVMVVDNFANSSPIALNRVERLTNKTFETVEASIGDQSSIHQVFQDFRPDAVIHFAGLKAVGQSEEQPLMYYDNNVTGTLHLLQAMDASGCQKIIFSSSATVYGTPHYLPYDETHPIQPVNPYGRTKYFIEEIIKDWAAVDASRSSLLLRYFNPVGAHISGQIGEDPMGIPNNLMPYIQQVAVGRREKLHVFGNDYDTPDGTGVRDYIHVTDLAKGHVAALDYCAKNQGVEAVNLGTGQGYSVMEIIAAFERASGQTIPYEFAPRRQGDIAMFYADPEKAKTMLGWQAAMTLDDMAQDSWRWIADNPEGYQD